MKKAITALCLMTLILLSCSFAYAETRNSGMFYYEIKGNGTAKITGYNWDKHTKGADIYIPRMLDGYTVTEIGEAAFAYIDDEYYSSISCTVPSPSYDAKHSIGSLIIPDTIRTIGDKAFMNISMNSYSLSIPASVEYIGSGAFANLDGLKQFVVASGNPTYATINGILYNKQEKELVAFPVKYNREQLPGTKYSHTLTIPDGIVKIGDYAFFNFCVESISIVLPETLTTIGNYAFAYSEFYTAKSLASPQKYFTFPDTLQNIGEGAFGEVSTSFEYYELIDLSSTKITEIPALAFGKARYFNIKLPNNLESIGECAFWESNGYPDNAINQRRSDYPITIIPPTVTKIGPFPG